MNQDVSGREKICWRDVLLPTVEFPRFHEGRLIVDEVLAAFFLMEGVGWADRALQRQRAKLVISDEALASKLLLFQKLGVFHEHFGRIRLTGFGHSLHELYSTSCKSGVEGRLISEESDRLAQTLRVEAINVLSRYQQSHPTASGSDRRWNLFDILPFQCVWKAMLLLGGSIHVQELERVIFNMSSMKHMEAAVEKITEARLNVKDYAACDDATLEAMLGERYSDNAKLSPIELFCFAGWKGLAIDADDRGGFYAFMPESEAAIKRVVDSPTKPVTTSDEREWINHYSNWSDAGSVIADHIDIVTRRCLDSYHANPLLVQEHYNIEQSVAGGGYGHRQLYELVQNGADALQRFPDGLIQVVLTPGALYCANEGEPFTLAGVDSILTSHISEKRGTEIGRFGLGFKSVLGISTRPEVYSRSISFVFDRSKAETLVKTEIPDIQKCPVLRVAFPQDPKPTENSDPILRELMKWADTVIKLPLDVPGMDWIGGDLAEFPAEFMLFCEHVGCLVLESRTSTSSERREIIVMSDGSEVELEERNVETTKWKVFRTIHRPTAGAKEDAGELTRRDEVPLAWAVPLDARDGQSKFWAFFPTEQLTKLSGILNAPWKTNEDRQNLLQGAYNLELLNQAAKLVVNNLGELSSAEDPARFLDFLPGRPEEYLNWADHELNLAIYRVAASSKCMPDMDRVLRTPSDLRVHPADISEEALRLWSVSPNRPSDYCHPSCVKNPTRRARAERLMGLVPYKAGKVTEWLEDLVGDGSLESSLSAVKIAAAVIGSNPSDVTAREAENSRILLTEGGDLVCPDPCAVFIRNENSPDGTDALEVHRHISADKEGRKALDVLGITALSSAALLQSLLAKKASMTPDEDLWPHFWLLASDVPVEQVKEIVGQHLRVPVSSSIKVRTMSGKFRPINETLIPGRIVPSDGQRDAALAIDIGHHCDHVGLLKDLGAVEYPQPGRGLKTELWFGDYVLWAKGIYYQQLQTDSRPHWDKLVFKSGRFPGPIAPISELSAEGKILFTRTILDYSAEKDPWVLMHQTRRDHYPELELDPPHIWMIKNHGMMDTSLGPVPVPQCVSPALGEWSSLLPVADCTPEAVSLLGMPNRLEELGLDQMNEAIKRASSLSDMDYLTGFYCFASDCLEPPRLIRCLIGDTVGDCRPAEVVAVHDQGMRSVLETTGLPYVYMEDRAALDRLSRNWGLKPASSVITTDLDAHPSGSSVAVTDRFLGLGSELEDDESDLLMIPCSFIGRTVRTPKGTLNAECYAERAGDIIYFLDKLTDEELLDAIANLLHISLDPDKRLDVLTQRAAESTRRLRLSISGSPTLAEKLLEAVGLEALLKRLYKPVLDIAQERFGELCEHPVEIADLAMAVFGVEILKLFQEELEKRGLCPPQRWAGSYNARKFVKDLGFPEEYAGFESSSRESVMAISGPPDLPKLHSFQVKLCSNIRARILDPQHKRGLLSLPTGAGKTRIAVQALIEAVKENTLRAPILWVAQSDELCEQAVQTWSEVWRSVGPRHTLHINRLWAQNEADYYHEGVQVVVATIDKLQICFGDSYYEWLKDVGCLVIDEAHTAVTTEFGRLFRFLGLERGRDRLPVIGLTATPFRGSEEMTRLLASRFQSNRLDHGVFSTDNPYPLLQDMKILAKAKHGLLPYAIAVNLSKEEEEHLRRFDKLASSVESRIGSDVTRNKIILDALKDLPSDWPVLLFATSVEHAYVMAALLNWEGISSVAISAGTTAGARRYYIEQFRQQKLRVLTNYGVLTAGFDAPAVRAVVITRPTFSPGLYLQMVGRGLRGPKNGGKEECLIVDIEDNFRQYGKELAFTEFEYIWK